MWNGHERDTRSHTFILLSAPIRARFFFSFFFSFFLCIKRDAGPRNVQQWHKRAGDTWPNILLQIWNVLPNTLDEIKCTHCERTWLSRFSHAFERLWDDGTRRIYTRGVTDFFFFIFLLKMGKICIRTPRKNQFGFCDERNAVYMFTNPCPPTVFGEQVHAAHIQEHAK